MKRSEHFLFRSRPSPWPKAVVAVSVDVTWNQDATFAAREVVLLRRWSVAVATPIASGYITSRIASGVSSDGFWMGLLECAERADGITLLCSCTREAAAALHLWERLENGDVTIAGSDHRNSGASGRTMSDMQGCSAASPLGQPDQVDANPLSTLRSDMGEKRRNGRRHRTKTTGRPGGVMVLQDPPIIMELQLPGCPHKITWLDVANYGLDSSAMFGRDEHTAVKIATWFCGVASALKQLGPCGWQNTAGSQAMHLFRSTYLGVPTLSHTHPIASALERAALFGGRCECFRVGKVSGNVHLLDVRSMYPRLCSDLNVPVRLSRVLEGTTPDELRLLHPDTFAIAEVAIQTDEPDYPVRHGNAVVYPTGRYWTHLAGAELDHALQAGVVRGVRFAAMYETEPAIAGYAEALYRLRCDYDRSGRKAESAYIKRLLVAIVGKFAQSERSWVDYPDGESAFEWGEWYQRNRNGESERWRSIAGHLQREQIGGWSHGAVPAITVCITAAGRSRLCGIMDAAGRENVLYCDTDAVIVSDFGMESLTIAGWVRPGEWGYLQHVESAGECTIYGDKYYTIAGRVRQAGGPHNAIGTSGSGNIAYSQPWIGASMHNRERPADWRHTRTYQRGAGRYDKMRGAGGIVRPIELWEW